ncbi:hypothetical protein [Leeuwenhoekiella sp. LLG6367-2.1]|uniref:hypothetical protein n=1 Tax=Leeuwenhoekiella sp. LLG6367-2.1 TaxID=3160833 RepID=UPI0038695ADE
MYEVELKVKLEDYYLTRKNILKIQPTSTILYEYFDRYYDLNDTLTRSEQELRLRTKTNLLTSQESHFLTFKDSPFDLYSKSKPEFESEIIEPIAIDSLLKKLNYTESLSYKKNCEVFNVVFEDNELEVSLVKIRGLKDSFLEVETLSETLSNTLNLLKMLHRYLTEIKLSESQICTTYYVDMLKEVREAE